MTSTVNPVETRTGVELYRVRYEDRNYTLRDLHETISALSYATVFFDLLENSPSGLLAIPPLEYDGIEETLEIAVERVTLNSPLVLILSATGTASTALGLMAVRLLRIRTRVYQELARGTRAKTDSIHAQIEEEIAVDLLHQVVEKLQLRDQSHTNDLAALMSQAQHTFIRGIAPIAAIEPIEEQ